MSAAKKTLDDGASVAEHARRLRQRAGWDPAALDAERGQRLEHQRSQLRIAEVDQLSQDCTDCANLRASGEDDTVMCRRHFAQALGVDSDGGQS